MKKTTTPKMKLVKCPACGAVGHVVPMKGVTVLCPACAKEAMSQWVEATRDAKTVSLKEHAAFYKNRSICLQEMGMHATHAKCRANATCKG